MKVLLLIAYLIVCAVIIMAVPPIVAEFPDYADFSIMDAGQAVLVCLILAGIVGYFIYQDKEEAPAATLCVGPVDKNARGHGHLHVQHAGIFRRRCDYLRLLRRRANERGKETLLQSHRRSRWAAGVAWGMVNVIALIYTVIGRNTLAIQFVNSVIGAATAVLVFYCAQHVYRNMRAARIAAICVAFFPARSCPRRG